MERRINNKYLYVAFSIYLIILVWVIALKFNAEWLPEIGVYFRKLPLWDRVGYNIIPFYSMFKNGFYFNLDYFMNVVIYIPLGIYLSLIFNNKKVLNIMIIFFSSLIFELIQLFTGFGGCDGTDLFCNALGGILGIGLYVILINKISNKTINVINIVVSIIFSPLAVFAIINTIINWELYLIY